MITKTGKIICSIGNEGISEAFQGKHNKYHDTNMSYVDNNSQFYIAFCITNLCFSLMMLDSNFIPTS